MRKVFAIAALGLLTLTLPALAAVPASVDDTDQGYAGGGVRSIECAGDVVWDTGMFDEFTPPAGCSSAASAGCFVTAINDGAFPTDGRRLADDFVSDGRPISGLKTWARYNQAGYDYHLATPGSLHGFCVKFYEFNGNCPDGTVPGEEAIGTIVYDEYTSNFVEEEVFTGLVRNFANCITLDPCFYPTVDVVYWASASADFDFTSYGGGVTQWFWRLYSGLGISYCEASWWDTWNDPDTNWNAVSVAINLPCWAGWDASLKVYAGCAPPPTTGACCLANYGGCVVTTRAECDAAGGTYQGDDVPCDPNPCPTATRSTSWGAIKADYR